MLLPPTPARGSVCVNVHGLQVPPAAVSFSPSSSGPRPSWDEPSPGSPPEPHWVTSPHQSTLSRPRLAPWLAAGGVCVGEPVEEPQATAGSQSHVPMALGWEVRVPGRAQGRGLRGLKAGPLPASLPHPRVFLFPQMNMLMKLQEAANYSGTQSCDSDSTSHHEDILDSSLESTL